MHDFKDVVRFEPPPVAFSQDTTVNTADNATATIQIPVRVH